MKSYLCNENYIELFLLDTWNKCVHYSGMDFEDQSPDLRRFVEWCRMASMISYDEADRLQRTIGVMTQRWIKECTESGSPALIESRGYPLRSK